MPKPKLILRPKRTTLYLTEEAADRGKEIARVTGTSLSQLVTELLNECSDSHKVRVHVEFPAHEYAEIGRQAEDAGMTIADFVRVAAQQLLSHP